MQTLRLTTVQSSLHWENVAANLKMFEHKLQALTGTTDLVVLPEMFTTGFSMNAKSLAEGVDGQTIRWLIKQAASINAAIIGSFIVVENGNYFNRAVVVFPDGTIQYYNKRHLFTLADEHLTFTAGDRLLIFEWKGWRICPLICYDLRFPVWSRNTDNYDLLIFMANWPHQRRQAWKSLLEARAIENQSYTVGVNRVGSDGTGHSYVGDTSIVDFAGNVLYRIAKVEGISTLELSYEQQKEFRNKLQFLNDRDLFEIQNKEISKQL